MNQEKNRYFVLSILLCAFLAACVNNTANNISEQSTLTTPEEISQETTTIESGEISEILPGEGKGTEIGPPKVPSVTPVENLSQLLFKREDVQKVMVVIDRRGFDDITATANEEEMNAVLDELYAADLSQFKDIGEEACGGVVVTYKLCTNEKEINLSIYQDVFGKNQHYLKIRDQDRMPLAEIKGPTDIFNFKRLDELSTEIKLNMDDPLYSGTASIIETGAETKLSKRSCGYVLYFFETSLKDKKYDVLDETILFNVQIEIGDIVYRLQSDTGYFSKQTADRIVYGKLDEQGLFMVITEGHMRHMLNRE